MSSASNTDSQSAKSIDVGDMIILPDTHRRPNHVGDQVLIIDFTAPSEYGPHVYAYSDPDSEDHRGLFVANDGDSVEVVA